MGWLTLRSHLKELFGAKADVATDAARERKMSSSSTGSMKNKWLKAFKSLKTTPAGNGASGGGGAGAREADKRNGKGEREMSQQPVDASAHQFQEYTYKKITPCDVCSQVLRGHTRQGLKCRNCKMNVHLDCQDKLGRCQPKSRLLRRQKSTSEIETRLPEPPEEETPHSPRRQKLNLRMKSLSLDSPESTEHVQRRRHAAQSTCLDPQSSHSSSSRIQCKEAVSHLLVQSLLLLMSLCCVSLHSLLRAR